jgi:Protein of unknown function (DUF1549)/Protein of unknown function (DUF1553)
MAFRTKLLPEDRGMSARRFPRLSYCLVALCFASPAVAGVDLPSGGKLEKVDFERHIMGLFSKAGCNNGSCHGSFQGKNGFRLSLFGFDPDKDFAALTRDIQGRRIDTIHPDNSLLLLKGAGLMRHEGGARFSKDSWQYQIFQEWIKAGAPRTKGSGEIVDIEINPKEYVFVHVGETAKMKVTAKFADGSKEDITPFCDFRVQDDAIARVSILGDITGLQPGDSGFVVLYRGKVSSARILVPTKATDVKYPAEVNYVDKEVFAKLKKLNVVPSDLASDTEFLRRVTIDVTGSLPTTEEIRSFLADKSASKREKKIDDLLKNSRHAALWATKFSDITGNNTQALEQPADMQMKRSQMWHDWVRVRLEKNVPYDEIVKGMLTATSLEGLTPEQWLEQTKKIEADAAKYDTSEYSKRATNDLFWRRLGAVQSIEWGEKAAAAFLGVRLECAQCHKHPFDRWTQADYRAFANVFAGVTFNKALYSTPAMKKMVDAENAERTKEAAGNKAKQANTVREMFVSTDFNRKSGLLTHPDTNQVLEPKAPAGPEFKFEKGKDIRADLFAWMRSADNPFFARSFVNRIWGHYFGVGLVDPVDDFSQANPPSNARLLDALAKDFIAHNYDIRHIERTILVSRTYQNSSVPNETNRFDKVNYARSYVRSMLAEVVVDVVNDALGTSETYNLGGKDDPAAKAMDGKRLIEIGSSRMNNGNLAYALRIFGRPPRTTACDCERTMEPALPQTLFRMTDAGLLQKMKASTNRVALLLKDKSKTDDEVFEEIFLATMSRYPRPDEVAVFKDHRKTTSDRTAAFTDVSWALINTREFILNH